MARGAGGLHGSRIRWRRAHGPALALSCTLGTPLARSSAAPLIRASAAIFPASRPARALREPAQFCPSRVGRTWHTALPLVHSTWGGSRERCPAYYFTLRDQFNPLGG